MGGYNRDGLEGGKRSKGVTNALFTSEWEIYWDFQLQFPSQSTEMEMMIGNRK